MDKTHLTQPLVKLGAIIKKNIKRLLQSKISASMVIFGPLVLIFLMGLAFNGSGFYGVSVGVYSDTYNNVSTAIVDAMKDSDFSVYQASTLDSCIQGVKDGKDQLCISFPENFSKDKMEFYVDYSRMNLVYAIINKLSSKIEQISKDISLSATQDLLDFIDTASESLEESSGTIDTIRTNSKDLQVQLDKIQILLAGSDVDQGLDMLNQITDNSSDLNKNITSIIVNLNLLESEVQNTRSELQPLEQQLSQQVIGITATQVQYKCNDTNSEDLSEYISSPSFPQKLNDSENPTCTLLLTTKNTLLEQKSRLTNTITYIDSILNYMSDMEGQITSFKSQINGDASQAKGELLSFDSAKNNLTQELTGIKEGANVTVETLSTLLEGLDELIEKFDEISLTDAKSVIKPIKTLVKSLSSKKINNLEILFPAILIMVMMFEGILIGNTLVMREKKSRAFFRNKILPVRNEAFIIGTYLTVIILTLIQVLIVVLIGIIVFNVSLTFNVLSLIPIILLSIVLFSSIGMTIGYISSSEETAILISVILSIIFLLFSNLVIPTETMERTIGAVASLTPFNICEELLRRSLIFDATIITSGLIATIALLIELMILVGAVIYTHNKSYNLDR